MKQYYITSLHLNTDAADDCVLAPDDPIHAVKAAQYLDGLGGDQYLRQLAEANAASLPPTATPINKAQIMRERNIAPGTEAWFKLWYGTNQ